MTFIGIEAFLYEAHDFSWVKFDQCGWGWMEIISCCLYLVSIDCFLLDDIYIYTLLMKRTRKVKKKHTGKFAQPPVELTATAVRVYPVTGHTLTDVFFIVCLMVNN